MQPTIKLYESDARQLTFRAQVLACTEKGNAWAVVLDQTAFYPEGGGQPCDTGTLGGVAVSDVHREEATGIITHTCAAALPVGQEAEGVIDADRRFDHMQQHSGEHILSGTLHRLYGAENVGFHIGTPNVRMDVDLPLTAEQLRVAEAEANAAVRADLPFRCWYPEADALAALPYRSKKPIEGAVRLVDAAGADLCACCGTHVERSGEVGLIKIISAQGYKGGVRLAVACGQRAVDTVAEVWADAEEAGRSLSAAAGALAPALSRFFATDGDNRRRLAALQNELAAAYAAAAVPGKVCVLHTEGADGDGARRIALAVSERTAAPCAVFFPGKSTDVMNYALAGAAGGDIRAAAKAMNEACGGRGGGNAAFCQGSLAAGAVERAAGLLADL